MMRNSIEIDKSYIGSLGEIFVFKPEYLGSIDSIQLLARLSHGYLSIRACPAGTEPKIVSMSWDPNLVLHQPWLLLLGWADAQ